MSAFDASVAALDAAVDGLVGRAGLLVQAVDGAVIYERSADEVFPAASVIKIPLLMTVYADAADGRLSLDERLGVGDRVDGTGVLRHLPDVRQASVRDLATLMTIVSDNTATNRLIERVGLERVHARLGEWSCDRTRFQRKMFDTEAVRLGRENVATPREIAALLLRLVRGELRDPATSAAVVAVLEQTQDAALIRRYLPVKARVAHKTGSLDTVRNDAAIVWADRPVVAVGFVKDLVDVRAARPLLGLLGWIAYQGAGGEAVGLPSEWPVRA